MLYKVKDKLIGVGVVDLTRECLSSVYFFYDPDYSDHSLGTLSSIVEIFYVKHLNKFFPNFKYYYLGYYV